MARISDFSIYNSIANHNNPPDNVIRNRIKLNRLKKHIFNLRAANACRRIHTQSGMVAMCACARK